MTALPTAAPSALWDHVNPCTNPPDATVSKTSPLAAANPNGT